MTLFFNKFFPPEVTAFVSDTSVDFKLNDNDNVITETQKKYLSSQSKTTLAEVFTIRQVHGKKVVNVAVGQKHPRPLLEADGPELADGREHRGADRTDHRWSLSPDPASDLRVLDAADDRVGGDRPDDSDGDHRGDPPRADEPQGAQRGAPPDGDAG